MQIDREGIHGNHFVWFCACQMTQPFRKALMVVYPWIRGVKVTFDAPFGPVLKFSFQRLLCRLWLQAQGVSCEIDGLFPTDQGNVKSLSKSA